MPNGPRKKICTVDCVRQVRLRRGTGQAVGVVVRAALPKDSLHGELPQPQAPARKKLLWIIEHGKQALVVVFVNDYSERTCTGLLSKLDDYPVDYAAFFHLCRIVVFDFCECPT